MDFHQLAFGPSPQQNNLGGRGDLLVNNFWKSMACHTFLGINRCICVLLTYPKNFKKIYHLEKKLWSFVYQNVGFVENILSVTDTSQRYQGVNYQLQLT